MKKPICICGVVLGALLVTFAAVLVVVSDSPANTIDASQRLRLERAVSQLDGCLTCHDPSNMTDTEQVTVVAASAPAYSYLAYATDAASDSSANAYTPALPQISPAVQADMRAIGQRILDLPVSNAEQVDAITADFLAVYDAAIAAESSIELGSTLAALSAIEEQLRTLEYQAHTVKLAATTSSDQAPDTLDALLVVPQSPVTAAWTSPTALVMTDANTHERVAGTQPVRAAMMTAADVQRRGPPAAFDNLFDSFG